jgi:hypothetical protein
LIEELAQRDGDRCFYCSCDFGDGKREITLDHVVARSRRGRLRLANTRLACRKCNGLKGSMSAEEFEKSLRLERRRQAVRREQAVASGAVIPKHAYNHGGLTWLGQGSWRCADCGASGGSSPALVVCEARRWELARSASS